MSIQNAYDLWSPTYDSDVNLTRDLDQAVTRARLANMNFGFILELGCGTGKNTAFLSQVGQRLIAVDFSEGMLKIARQKLKHVAFCAADAGRLLPFTSGFANLITCNLVLEHIEHLAPVFSEAYRLLVKGGRLFVSELHPFRQYQGKKARFELAGETVQVEAYVHHVSDFYGAALESGLSLEGLGEHWHAEDQGGPPRLTTFMFRK